MKTATETAVPLLLSAPMARAYGADLKDRTRRGLRVPKRWGDVDLREYDLEYHYPVTGEVSFSHKVTKERVVFRLPYRVGRTIVFKETWCEYRKGRYIYRADYDQFTPISDGIGGPWKSALFMPIIAARFTPRILAVRVERLLDITEEDAIAEGMQAPGIPAALTNVSAFLTYWDSLHGPGAHRENPWVACVTFERFQGATK